MHRDTEGTPAYWARWVTWDDQTIPKVWQSVSQPAGNPGYRPRYCFELARPHWGAMLRRYSAGRPVAELAPLFDGLLRAWEESVQLGETVLTPERKALRNSWARNLEFYNTCLWLTGLALTLEIPDAPWQRLLRLMGNEGEDLLLDRVIATHAPAARTKARRSLPPGPTPKAAHQVIPGPTTLGARVPQLQALPPPRHAASSGNAGSARAIESHRLQQTQPLNGSAMHLAHPPARTPAQRVGTPLALLLATLLAACATNPTDNYTPPAADAPAAELELRLMLPSRNRSAALYVPGAVKCNPSAVTALLKPKIEDPPQLVAGSWESRFKPVVRLPAGTPLALRFRYQGPGEDWVIDRVVVLQPGRRYLLEHEIPGVGFTVNGAADGRPAPSLPPSWFHAQLNCPK